MKTFHSTLEINDLQFNVNLGYSKEERSVAQKISVSIKIFFESIPKACKNDNLEDTICYDQLSKKLEQICLSKEFSLIEHLAYKLFEAVKHITDNKIEVKVTKLNPPIKNLINGSSFKIKDNL